MPWSKDNVPSVAKNWTTSEQQKCVVAANSVKSKGGSDQDAVFACINAAGKSKQHAAGLDGNTLDAEIFATGKWNGKVFTADDLNSIASAFNELKDILTPPLKLGHNEEQPLKDGDLALGWIEDVWVEGNKLMSRFANLPTVVYDALKKKLYRKVSIELMPDVTYKGKHYKYVLSAAALLGAALPSVNVLADLDKFLATDQINKDNVLTFTAIDTKRIKTMEINEEEYKRLKEAAENATKFSTQLQDLQTREKERIEQERKDRIKFKRTEVNDLLETSVKANEITPAQRDTFTAMMRLDDDTAVESINVETVKQYIAANKRDTNVGHQQGSQQGASTDDDVKNPSDKLDALIHEYMVKHGERDYQNAQFAVMRAHPKLADAFKFANGEYKYQ